MQGFIEINHPKVPLSIDSRNKSPIKLQPLAQVNNNSRSNCSPIKPQQNSDKQLFCPSESTNDTQNNNSNNQIDSKQQSMQHLSFDINDCQLITNEDIATISKNFKQIIKNNLESISRLDMPHQFLSQINKIILQKLQILIGHVDTKACLALIIQEYCIKITNKLYGNAYDFVADMDKKCYLKEYTAAITTNIKNNNFTLKSLLNELMVIPCKQNELNSLKSLCIDLLEINYNAPNKIQTFQDITKFLIYSVIIIYKCCKLLLNLPIDLQNNHCILINRLILGIIRLIPNEINIEKNDILNGVVIKLNQNAKSIKKQQQNYQSFYFLIKNANSNSLIRIQNETLQGELTFNIMNGLIKYNRHSRQFFFNNQLKNRDDTVEFIKWHKQNSWANLSDIKDIYLKSLNEIRLIIIKSIIAKSLPNGIENFIEMTKEEKLEYTKIIYLNNVDNKYYLKDNLFALCTQCVKNQINSLKDTTNNQVNQLSTNHVRNIMNELDRMSKALLLLEEIYMQSAINDVAVRLFKKFLGIAQNLKIVVQDLPDSVSKKIALLIASNCQSLFNTLIYLIKAEFYLRSINKHPFITDKNTSYINYPSEILAGMVQTHTVDLNQLKSWFGSQVDYINQVDYILMLRDVKLLPYLYNNNNTYFQNFDLYFNLPIIVLKQSLDNNISLDSFNYFRIDVTKFNNNKIENIIHSAHNLLQKLYLLSEEKLTINNKCNEVEEKIDDFELIIQTDNEAYNLQNNDDNIQENDKQIVYKNNIHKTQTHMSQIVINFDTNNCYMELILFTTIISLIEANNTHDIKHNVLLTIFENIIKCRKFILSDNQIIDKELLINIYQAIKNNQFNSNESKVILENLNDNISIKELINQSYCDAFDAHLSANWQIVVNDNKQLAQNRKESDDFEFLNEV